jgi:chromosome segregation ATPase
MAQPVERIEATLTERVPSTDVENFPVTWIDVYNIWVVGQTQQHQRWEASLDELDQRETRVTELENRLQSRGGKYEKIKAIALQIESERQAKDEEIDGLKARLKEIAVERMDLSDYSINLKKRFDEIETRNATLQQEKTDVQTRLAAFEANAARAPELADVQAKLAAKTNELEQANKQTKTWYDLYDKQKKKTADAERERSKT